MPNRVWLACTAMFLQGSPMEEAQQHIEELKAVLIRLGAEPSQAGVMAAQLWKRSAQMAHERGIKQVEALDYLLRLTVSGRQGIPPSEVSDEAQTADPQDEKK